jgi:hypothetical protein
MVWPTAIIFSRLDQFFLLNAFPAMDSKKPLTNAPRTNGTDRIKSLFSSLNGIALPASSLNASSSQPYILILIPKKDRIPG